MSTFGAAAHVTAVTAQGPGDIMQLGSMLWYILASFSQCTRLVRAGVTAVFWKYRRLLYVAIETTRKLGK